jgi:hypothetical protein
LSTDIAPLLSSGINRNEWYAEAMIPSVLDRIFHMEEMDGAYKDVFSWRGYQNPQRRGPLEAVAPGTFAWNWGKRFIPVEYALGDIIALRDWQWDKYGIMTKVLPSKGGALARAHKVLREIIAAQFFQVLGFAADPAVLTTPVPTMVDGRPLFSNYHPIARDQPGTFSNRPSVDVDLANSSYQIAAAQLRQQPLPNVVELANNGPNKIVVNPNQGYLAKQILKENSNGQNWLSSQNSPSADRTPNWAIDDHIEIIEWPYFRVSGTNATAGNELAYNAWMLFADSHHCYFEDSQEVVINVDWIPNILAFLFVSYCRFVIGASDPRSCYGSKGN